MLDQTMCRVWGCARGKTMQGLRDERWDDRSDPIRDCVGDIALESRWLGIARVFDTMSMVTVRRKPPHSRSNSRHNLARGATGGRRSHELLGHMHTERARILFNSVAR